MCSSSEKSFHILLPFSNSYFMSKRVFLGLVYMEGGCPSYPNYPGRANFSYVSLENALKRLHAGQGNPPSGGTLPCLLARGTLLGGLSLYHVNDSSGVIRLAEVRGPRYIPRQLLMLTASGDYAQLLECKIIALDTVKRPLAERVIKKLNSPPKRFFCPPFCLLYLAAARPTISLR